MTKQEFVDKVADRANLSKRDAAEAVDAFLDSITDVLRSGGEVRWIESRSFITYTSDGRPRRVAGVNIDITGRQRAEEHQRMLVAELDHRVKNVLATVSAVTSHTQDLSGSVADFVAALDGRIKSMAATHQLY